MGAMRAGLLLAGFAGLTIPLLPVQELLLRLSPKRARTFPHWYHRQVCRVLGVRLHIEGEVIKDKPVLLVSNHTSWLDIPVLSAVAPVSFIAKREVSGWPGVKLLARLQRTVFVDRTRRTAVEGTTNEIRARLQAGDTLVLFAEGTSSDGNSVLPFKSSLFAATMPGRKNSKNIPVENAEKSGSSNPVTETAVVQTVALAYTHLHGVPIGRADRPIIGWYGDMEMLSHAWQLLKAGPLDVEIKIGVPVPVSKFKDRKHLANQSEEEVRKNLVRILRHREQNEDFHVTKPTEEQRKAPSLQHASVKPRKGMR